MVRSWLRLVAATALLPGCASHEGILDHGARSLRGRVGGRLVAEFDAGRSTHSLQVPSGVLTADVVRVTNDYRQRRVLVQIEFDNRSDDPLHIAVADVRLDALGQPHGAKLTRDLEMPPLRPRTRQTVEFTFELDAPPPGGVYPLTIARVFPHDRPFPLRIGVPGLPPAAAGPR
jgi:hypothetical protein